MTFVRLESIIGTFSKPRRRRERGRCKTKDLISGKVTQCVRLKECTFLSRPLFLTKYKWNCDYLFQQTDSSTLPIPKIIYALVLKFHTDRRYKQLKGWLFFAVVYNFLHRLTPLLWFDQIKGVKQTGEGKLLLGVNQNSRERYINRQKRQLHVGLILQ